MYQKFESMKNDKIFSIKAEKFVKILTKDLKFALIFLVQ